MSLGNRDHGGIVDPLATERAGMVTLYLDVGAPELYPNKQATHWAQLWCHRFRANEARLQLSLLAHNLGNL